MVCFCLHSEKLEPQWSVLSQSRTLTAQTLGHQGQSVLASNHVARELAVLIHLSVAGDVGTFVYQPFKEYFLSSHHMQRSVLGMLLSY